MGGGDHANPRAGRAKLPMPTALGVLAALVVAGGAAPAQEPSQTSATACADAQLQPGLSTIRRVELAIACLINEQRALAALPPLRMDGRLEDSAAFHTADMINRSFFAHQARGRPSVLQRIRSARYFTRVVTGLYAENLGFGPPERATAENLVRAFMKSDVHRANILYPGVAHQGVSGALADPDSAFYSDYPAAVFTIDFGARMRKANRSIRRRCARPRRVRRVTDPSATPPRRYCARKTPRRRARR